MGANVIIKKYINKLICGFSLIAILTQACCPYALATSSTNGAFTADAKTAAENFASQYGWNTSYLTAPSWAVNYTDGPETINRTAKYQKQFYDDNFASTKAYLGISTATGGSGGGIVATALNEIGEEGSLEIPKESNNVKYNSWYYSRDVSGEAYPWCCAFVAWCAEQNGLIEDGTFIRTASCTALFRYFTDDKCFSAVKTRDTAPMGGTDYTPVPGDIMFFYDGKKGEICHIGIVALVEEDCMFVVEGNSDGQGATIGGGVAKNKYSRDRLGSYSTVANGYIVHVEYPNSAEQVFNFLVNQVRLNKAAACGVMANIECESNFKSDIEEHGSQEGYGLCQWSFGRRDRLMSWCNDNNLDYRSSDGQLFYLLYELQTGYNESTLSKLLKVENSAQGAYDAGYIWCYNFERPSNYESVSVERGNIAMTRYWPNYGILS